MFSVFDRPSIVVDVFFTLTDRASTIPNNTRGCQSGTWSAGQKKIRGTSTKLQHSRSGRHIICTTYTSSALQSCIIISNAPVPSTCPLHTNK